MSQNRRRKRNRKPSGGDGAKPQQKKQNQRQRSEPKVDLVEFWGDPDALPEPLEAIGDVPDVKAVVRSLGRVPITGQETAAEHWFSLVYERAAVLAGALAAAGGLDGDRDDD